MGFQKVMVVDDSELLQKAYNVMLHRYTRNGVEIVRASNGREGLDQLHQHCDVDLIILDINMPEMSGLEFLQYRSRERALSKIPVIVVSTEGKEEDIMRGLAAGADAYLVKPFDLDEFHELIGKLTKAMVA